MDMVKWRVEDGQLQILFQSREDIRNFIRDVVLKPAEMLGLEVTIKDNPMEIIIREKSGQTKTEKTDRPIKTVRL